MIKKVALLAGGVGGAKMASGFALLDQIELSVIVNAGDDFRHLGLAISPDIDTVTYTLAGISSKERGWGIESDTRKVLQTLERYGGETWFDIGDQDFATSIYRTSKMDEGWSLTQITNQISTHLGVKRNITILPMSDDVVSTMVHTDEGILPFQTYFVKRRCLPRVSGFSFSGIEKAKPTPNVISAIEEAELIVIAPSNPWVSIAPILNLNGIHEMVEHKTIIAISPLIGGKTVKGPAAKMFSELGILPSNYSIAQFYGGILNGIFIDNLDAEDVEDIEKMGMFCIPTNTLMKNRGIAKKLAQDILNLSQRSELF